MKHAAIACSWRASWALTTPSHADHPEWWPTTWDATQNGDRRVNARRSAQAMETTPLIAVSMSWLVARIGGSLPNSIRPPPPGGGRWFTKPRQSCWRGSRAFGPRFRGPLRLPHLRDAPTLRARSDHPGARGPRTCSETAERAPQSLESGSTAFGSEVYSQDVDSVDSGEWDTPRGMSFGRGSEPASSAA